MLQILPSGSEASSSAVVNKKSFHVEGVSLSKNGPDAEVPEYIYRAILGQEL
jgi:hypothetical protein